MRKRELLDSGIAGEKKVWAETAYAYDENGNCIRIRTPEGYVLHRFFDDRDRLAHQVLEDREHDIRLSVIGFACVLFTLLGVSFFMGGLHSYGV